ncbi:MAG: permease [Deltaproteobacteria bacterium]|nr:permease [Deltaproteobacteria bacterium]
MLLKLVDWFVYYVLQLQAGSRLGETVSFFIYDSIKILLFLFLLIFAIGIIRTYLPQRKIKRWMSQKGIMGNFFAALFGAVTPFCSCSSLPIFLGFLEAGIPLGVSFSFLITSPLINEYLIILMMGMFGWKIAAAYLASGLCIGIFSGFVLGKMTLEPYLVSDLIAKRDNTEQEIVHQNFVQRIQFGWDEALSISNKIWLWVLVGVAVGAGIHNYIPQEAIQNIIEKTGVFSVPIATLLGVPLYGSCAAIVPVAVVLFQKGIPLGTALAFMMGMAALSLPEAIMLRRAMHVKLILIFFGITTLAIIFTGYLFNALQAQLL